MWLQIIATAKKVLSNEKGGGSWEVSIDRFYCLHFRRIFSVFCKDPGPLSFKNFFEYVLLNEQRTDSTHWPFTMKKLLLFHPWNQ